MEEKTPPSRLTYPRDIFILGLSDHGTESGPLTWSAEPPFLAECSSEASGQGRSGTGSGLTAGQVTLSHGSSSILQTCEAATPRLNECSICQPGHARQPVKVSPHMEREVKERELSSNQAAPPGSVLLTWWTDYLFTLSMNMKRPSRFNPALLSLSTRPIVARIFVAGSRGWA